MAGQDENKAARKFQKSYFDVLGLCCSSEVPVIENILRSLDGVKDVSVIVPSRTVIVVHDNLLITPIQIVKALNQARLEANVRVQGEQNFKQKWPSPYAVACGILLLISLLQYVYHPLQWLALGAVAVGIFPIAWKGIIALRNLRLDINILALIAVIGTVAMGDYLEAGTIVFLFSIAEWLESRASHKANAAMSSLMSLTPQKAVIAETGEVVDVDQVKLHTIIAVKAGEVIPIDGSVVEGDCEVDEKTLTGESFPVAKHKDDRVLAGTINLNGYISVRTTALAEDCVVAKMAKLVEEAQNNKSQTQRFIDKCAKYYTPVVVVISAAVAVIPLALRLHDLRYWFHMALVALVSACPCALVLSTPVATFCALTKAAKSGLLIKGGEYLEILAKIKNMAFDKTGTITRGEFVVTEFQSLSEEISFHTLVYWVSSIESKSSHPMAAALVDYGRSLSIEPKAEDVEDFQNFPGEGIHGRMNGKDIYIGNKKIASRAGIQTVHLPEGDPKDGKTIGYVYYGRDLAGVFSLSDACRTGVAEAIKELRSLKIKTAMLTGDNNAAAMHAQTQLGNALDVVHAELLPADKAKIIEEFKKEGPTAMIGDGLNDAPALATADIGISMGISGSALATETGHIVLMSNDIRKVPKGIRLARRARRKIIENVIVSITTKAAIIALALAGHPLVWAAVLADVGTCVLVILNSMLLLQGTNKHTGKCCKTSGTSHTNKHGCHATKSQQHCCSNSKAQERCELQECSSQKCASNCQSTSCGDKKCSDLLVQKGTGSGCCEGGHCPSKSTEADCCKSRCSVTKHCDGGSANKNQEADCCESGCAEAKHCDGGNCDKNVEADCCGSGCSESKHCDHGNCDMNCVADCCDSECSESKHCEDGNCGIKVHNTEHNIHNRGCNSSSCEKDSSENMIDKYAEGKVDIKDFNQACSGLKKQSNISPGKNHSPDKVTGNTAECSHSHQHRNAGDSFKAKCAAHHAALPHTTIDIMPANDNSRVRSRHACRNLEKRAVGGCCKSYMKECCRKHGHLGSGLPGRLSEIVTE